MYLLTQLQRVQKLKDYVKRNLFPEPLEYLTYMKNHAMESILISQNGDLGVTRVSTTRITQKSVNVGQTENGIYQWGTQESHVSFEKFFLKEYELPHS